MNPLVAQFTLEPLFVSFNIFLCSSCTFDQSHSLMEADCAHKHPGKQKLPQFADFFYHYFSCYIKVLDRQHNDISLFKIDCNYQPTDEIPLVKTL